jgi:hypothetical protein
MSGRAPCGSLPGRAGWRTRTPAGSSAWTQGCYLKGSRGSHRTPWRPVQDPLDPLQIGKVLQETLMH